MSGGPLTSGEPDTSFQSNVSVCAQALNMVLGAEVVPKSTAGLRRLERLSARRVKMPRHQVRRRRARPTDGTSELSELSVIEEGRKPAGEEEDRDRLLLLVPLRRIADEPSHPADYFCRCGGGRHKHERPAWSRAGQKPQFVPMHDVRIATLTRR